MNCSLMNWLMKALLSSLQVHTFFLADWPYTNKPVGSGLLPPRHIILYVYSCRLWLPLMVAYACLSMDMRTKFWHYIVTCTMSCLSGHQYSVDFYKVVG